MHRVTASREVAASPETVWQLLTDLDRWPEWGPSVRSARTNDGRALGIGVAGTVTTVVGLRLPFVVTEYTAGRSWSWRVARVPATNHLVEPTNDGCRVSMSVPLVVAPYVAICHVAIGRIARLVSEES